MVVVHISVSSSLVEMALHVPVQMSSNWMVMEKPVLLNAQKTALSVGRKVIASVSTIVGFVMEIRIVKVAMMKNKIVVSFEPAIISNYT